MGREQRFAKGIKRRDKCDDSTAAPNAKDELRGAPLSLLPAGLRDRAHKRKSSAAVRRETLRELWRNSNDFGEMCEPAEALY